MGSTVLLLRSGETSWCEQRRLLGRRDLGLSATGRAQAQQARDALGNLELAEIVSSPLTSAVETAEELATGRMSVGRDPRLNNLAAGPWEGRSVDELSQTPQFARMIAGDVDPFEGTETVESVRQRMVASVEQALNDNPAACTILMVGHSAPIRIVLAHYLEMPVAHYHRLRLSPGAFCVLRFEGALDITRVLAINWGGGLERLLQRI